MTRQFITVDYAATLQQTVTLAECLPADHLARQGAPVGAVAAGAARTTAAANPRPLRTSSTHWPGLLAARMIVRTLPDDIYVRWKPLHQQPVGWTPDLNDGVRLNIRPFVTAGVLRSKFTLNWKVDRGTNPDGTERINDRRLTRSEKQAVRRSYP